GIRLPRSGKNPPVGIIFAKESMTVVLPGGGLEGRAYVADMKTVVYPEETDLFSESFGGIVSRALAGIDKTRLARVWCVLPDSMVDIRYLKLPKTSGENLANAALWSYKKEVVADEKDIVFDYERLEEITERGVAKVGVCAYSAHKDAIVRVRELLEGAGCVIEGITSSAFALQTLLKNHTLNADMGNICCVHVGRDASVIHVFSGAGLMLVRQIRAGLASLAESMAGGGREETLHMESENTSRTAVEQLVRLMREMKPVAGTEADTLFPALGPAVERIGRQIERTIAYFRQNVQPDRMSAVLLHGEVAGYRPFVGAIADLLGIPVYTPDEMLSSDVKMVHSENLRQEAQFLTGLGLVRAGLADTPNLLFTFRDKRTYRTAAILNRSAWAACILAVVLCAGTAAWQAVSLSGLKQQKARLAGKGTGGDLDQTVLDRLSGDVKARQEALKRKAGKMEPRVLISELVARTPETVKLSGMNLSLSGTRRIDLSGYVFGGEYAQESALVAYVLDLSESPLFDQVTVNSRKKISLGGQNVLEFSATITL
ncbi:MAG: hypothetical protein ACOZBW_05085, partial [Thermodesulfobacteriota bacterium]